MQRAPQCSSAIREVLFYGWGLEALKNWPAQALQHFVPSWGKNLRCAIPSPVPWAKHHLSSLNKFALVFQWQIDCQSSLKVCHGWKPSTAIPKLTRSLNFPSTIATAPWIAWPHNTPRDAPWLCLSSDEIENSLRFGTRNRHQWTVNYVYMCMTLFFSVKSLIMLWQAHGWKGLVGQCGAQLMSQLWQGRSCLSRRFAEASPWLAMTWGAKLYICRLFCFGVFFKGNIDMLQCSRKMRKMTLV